MKYFDKSHRKYSSPLRYKIAVPCSGCIWLADGWVVILSCLSGSIIHELMDERVNELRVGPAQPGLTQTVRLIMAPFPAFSARTGGGKLFWFETEIIPERKSKLPPYESLPFVTHNGILGFQFTYTLLLTHGKNFYQHNITEFDLKVIKNTV